MYLLHVCMILVAHFCPSISVCCIMCLNRPLLLVWQPIRPLQPTLPMSVMLFAQVKLLIIVWCNQLDLSCVRSLSATTTTASGYFLILVGIPGSGKSFLCQNLQRGDWVIASQDNLGSVAAVRACVGDALRNNRCVVLDRCNASKRGRKTWIKYAKKIVPPSQVYRCLYLARHHAYV